MTRVSARTLTHGRGDSFTISNCSSSGRSDGSTPDRASTSRSCPVAPGGITIGPDAAKLRQPRERAARIEPRDAVAVDDVAAGEDQPGRAHRQPLVAADEGAVDREPLVARRVDDLETEGPRRPIVPGELHAAARRVTAGRAGTSRPDCAMSGSTRSTSGAARRNDARANVPK